MNVRIVIDNGYLDISKDFPVSLNYSLDDIKKPENRNTSHSKTIILPGSKNNNYHMGSLFDVNSTTLFFNPAIKINAKIIIGSTIVLDGFLQLKDIKKLPNVNLGGNHIQYEVVIFDKALDFFTELGEKKLTDLDFDQYGHTYSYTNITSSWQHTYKDVYTYPQLFNNSNLYPTSHWKPAIYHKAYLERIALESGFSLGGSFIDDNIDYEKEIIPFNGKLQELSQTEIDRRQFRAGITSDDTMMTVGFHANGWSSDNSYLVYPASGGVWSERCEPTLLHRFFSRSGYGVINSIPGSLNYDLSIPFILDDDSTSPNFDNGGVWDTTYGKWAIDRNGKYDLTFSGQIDFEVSMPGLLSTETGYLNHGQNSWQGLPTLQSAAGASNPNLPIQVQIRCYINGIHTGSSISGTALFPSQIDYNTTHTVQVTFNQNFLSAMTLNQTDEVTFRIGYGTSWAVGYAATDGSYNGWSGYQWLKVICKNRTNSTIYNSPLGGILTDDDAITIGDYIPKDFKCKDLFTDLIKRYNIYISIDKDNPRKLLLDTRDDFYNAGEIFDLTNKKDYESEDKIKLISQLQSKNMHFSYTEDEDDENKKYTSLTNDVYGEHEIEFINEFVKGDTEVSTPFSPTPLIYASTSHDRVVSAISTTEPENNIRVLYFGGTVSYTGDHWTFKWIDSSGTTQHTVYNNEYPYAGHFSDPYEPSLDLNYGAANVSINYNDLASVTNNNLYNTYWSNYINQLNTGRMLTSKFNLTAVDIQYIKNNMNCKVFIHRMGYYFINKVINYDPTKRGLTTLELIKIQIGVSSDKPFTKTPNTGDTPIKQLTDSEIKQNTVRNTEAGGSGPTVGGLETSYKGTNNNLSDSSKTIMSGSNIRIGSDSDRTMVIGDDSSIGDDVNNSGILGGDDCRIISGVENSWIIGSNDKTISQDNEIWIGDIHYIDGVNMNETFYWNLIDGGDGEVRSLSSQSSFNLIDGGDGEVRAIDYTNPENLIDGNGSGL